MEKEGNSVTVYTDCAVYNNRVMLPLYQLLMGTHLSASLIGVSAVIMVRRCTHYAICRKCKMRNKDWGIQQN